ncbi:MAG: ATP-dependent DNA helicase [Candidatus Omnitrophica bacterium]|nr:ATP-dependent DNA helicase [Candidatus Omnitrophota bacterium]
MINLNTQQKLAAETLDGPVLVLAGPGTGKTELLSVRAANIIKAKKARPENILILTYTNAAAKAMKERLVNLLGADAYNIETATFHSFANSVVLESEEAAEYIQERVQITDIEQIKLLEYILDNTDGIDKIRPFRAPYAFEREISQRITELKREGVSPAQFAKIIEKTEPDGAYIEEKHIERLKALATVYKLYEEYKAGKNKALFDDRGRYDYDDMILFAVEAIRNEPELKAALQKQYTYIMVDEFQDTNGAQMDLLFELVGDFGDSFSNSRTKGSELGNCHQNLCCVGDDDQSIFRFQGASVANFRELKKRFPKLKEIPLEKNYRSTKEIISLAGRIINNLPVKERVHAKELAPETDFKKKTIEYDEFTTETEELLFIARRIKEIANKEEVPLDEVAVLVRQRDDILKIVDTFLRAGIPYATDGKEDIAGEKRVRQMLDVLYFAHTPDLDIEQKDAYLYRILTADYMQIPMNDVLRFIAGVRVKKYEQRKKGEAPTVSMFSEIMNSVTASKIGDKNLVTASLIPAKSGNELGSCHQILSSLLFEAESRPVHAMLMQYIKDAGVMKFILDKYNKNDLLRIRDLRALTSFVNMVKESDIARPGITLKEFIDELETRKAHGMSLQGELVTATQEGVRIYTAHGSKGLEFHTVFIPFCLEKKRWPKRPQGVSIPLPPEVYKSKEVPTDKDILKQLDYYDETRLFYVASTRAKANLIYTASPTESAIPSSYLTGVADGGAAAKKEEDLLKAALEITDAEDPFIGTDKILKDLVAGISLNPTSLNNYINCPRKYLYDNALMLPSGKKQPLVFGNCTHKALENTYDKFMKTGKFPDFAFFKEAFAKELNHEAPEAAIKTACLRQVETFKAWFKEESRLPVKPLGLEKRLVVMLEDDLKFSGKYDKTEPVGTAAVRVIDYKTGEPDKHVKGINSSLSKEIPVASDEFEGYLRQLIAYKLLFDRDKNESQGRKVKEGVLVFLDPAKESVAKHDLKAGGFVKKKVELTEDMVAELESAIKDVRHRIKKLDFAKLPEIDEKPGKCGQGNNKCDFYDICWG